MGFVLLQIFNEEKSLGQSANSSTIIVFDAALFFSDAEEATLFYNDTLRHFSQSTATSRSIDTAFEEIRRIINENIGAPMLLAEAATKAAV